MKKILLGVTGSISAYKSADLTSQFVKLGAQVDVIMSKSSTHFITPLTLQSLSKRAVHTDVMQESNPQVINHIELAKQADLFLIAPATANIIGKLANGIADDLLSTVAMALPVGTLRSVGYQEIEPRESLLACGDFGKGALADIQTIIEQVMLTLNERNA